MTSNVIAATYVASDTPSHLCEGVLHFRIFIGTRSTYTLPISIPLETHDTFHLIPGEFPHHHASEELVYLGHFYEKYALEI